MVLYRSFLLKPHAMTFEAEECITSINRVIRIVELRMSAVTSQLVTANIVASPPILVTLMMEVTRSSETSVFTRVTWHNIPEHDILHSHQHENLKPYKL
jgi:hypothetical protein